MEIITIFLHLIIFVGADGKVRKAIRKSLIKADCKDARGTRKDECCWQDPFCCECPGQYHNICDPPGVSVINLPDLILPTGKVGCPTINPSTTVLKTTQPSTSPTPSTTRPPLHIDAVHGVDPISPCKDAAATSKPSTDKPVESTAAPSTTPSATENVGSTAVPSTTPSATEHAGSTGAPSTTPSSTENAGSTSAPSTTPLATEHAGSTGAPSTTPSATENAGSTAAFTTASTTDSTTDPTTVPTTASTTASTTAIEVSTAASTTPTVNPTTIKPFEAIEDGVLFEGDMVLPKEDVDLFLAKEGLLDDPAAGKRKADEKKWPDKIVPYVLDGSIADKEKDRRSWLSKKLSFKKKDKKESKLEKKIKEGMKQWEKESGHCIKFEERKVEDDYVEFKLGDRCYSNVGRARGKQVVSVGLNCEDQVIHLIGHALGLYHEQSRPDRDEYITVNWDNIAPGDRANFGKYHRFLKEKLPKYDITSIMHYSADEIVKNSIEKRKDSFISKAVDKVSFWKKKMGQREDVTDEDGDKIKHLYDC